MSETQMQNLDYCAACSELFGSMLGNSYCERCWVALCTDAEEAFVVDDDDDDDAPEVAPPDLQEPGSNIKCNSMRHVTLEASRYT